MADVTIKFLQSYTVKDEAATTYAEGEEVTLVSSSANHFINRGVAEVVEKPAKSATKTASK